MADTYFTLTATIASGSSLSGEINLNGNELVGMILPGAWTTGALTFQMGLTPGGTFHSMYDEAGNELTVASATVTTVLGSFLRLPATILRPGVPLLKIRAGTRLSQVPQGADRTFTLICLARR